MTGPRQDRPQHARQGSGDGRCTDAAFAGLHARGAVIEGFGLTGTGAHSNNDERIDLTTLEPRLYLIARLIQELGAAGQ